MGFSLDYKERLLPSCLPAPCLPRSSRPPPPTRPASPRSSGDPDPWLSTTVENADPAADLDPLLCSALPAGTNSARRFSLRPLGLAGAWCQRDLGSSGLQGFLLLGFSQLSADWTAEETAPVAYAHATPPPPPPPPARPPCTPPTPPPKALLSTLFSLPPDLPLPPPCLQFSVSWVLGGSTGKRCHFISRNQRRKGQLTERQGQRSQSACAAEYPPPLHTHTNKHTHTPSGAGTSPTYLHFHSRSVQRAYF